jgi:hypothetical protein
MPVSEADYLDMLDLIAGAALEPAAREKVLRRLASFVRILMCVVPSDFLACESYFARHCPKSASAGLTMSGSTASADPP